MTEPTQDDYTTFAEDDDPRSLTGEPADAPEGTDEVLSDVGEEEL